MFLFCICSGSRRCLIVGAMKTISFSYGQSGDRNRGLVPSWRWGAALLGLRRATDRTLADRTIEFTLDKNSLGRIAGSVRGVRIGCRLGRLWLTQSGAPADVILQPGQSFVADAGGSIVVQPVPGFNAPVETAVGTLTMNTGAARLKIHSRQTVAAPARIGMGQADRDRTGMWEHLAFITVWLCGGFSVWYCLKTLDRKSVV